MRSPRGSWLHFRNDEEAVFSCRTPKGSFPPVESLVKDIQGEKIELPLTLRNTLRRAEILTKKNEVIGESLIGIEISGNILTCRGRNHNGWFQEEMEVNYRGKKIQFQQNPTWLSQILRKSQQVTVGKKYMSFTGDKFDHVLIHLQ